MCCVGFDRKVDLLYHMLDINEDGHLAFVKEIIGYSFGACSLLTSVQLLAALLDCLSAVAVPRQTKHAQCPRVWVGELSLQVQS